MRIQLYFFLALLSGHLVSAQTGTNWHYNINDQNVIIDGYDVVAYHRLDSAIQGKKEFQSTRNGVHFWFSTSEHKRLFESSPEKYEPAYGGWCTFFMGIDKTKANFAQTRMRSDPTNFKLIEGKLHLFNANPNQNFKTVFENAESEEILKRAEVFWGTRNVYAENSKGLPEGMNRMARMELLDWQPFMGEWEVDLQWWADTTGTRVSRSRGAWEFYYGYYGFCIQDDFRQVPAAPYSGTINGPGIRGYDPVAEEWHMTYIPVNLPRSATWMMRANFVGPGHLEGQMETQDPYGNPILQKIVFKKVNENEFHWRAHWSWDGGKTWKMNAGSADCKRKG